MHADIHLMMHHQRAAELWREAAPRRASAPRGPDLRTRLGWALVEVGLRLATAPRRLGHSM
ncbi:hypothetical protein JNUCC64_22250 [Streptomyces sp. JNUCC 64]